MHVPDGCHEEITAKFLTFKAAGKWKARIIRVLGDGPRPFRQLRREFGGITQQVLSAQLKALEQYGMVRPEATELLAQLGSTFSLTDEAWSLLPALNALARWGADRLWREGITWSEAQAPLGLS